MRLLFHRKAEREIADASEYYKLQRIGLGREFEGAIEAACQLILTNPTVWPVQIKDVRRYTLSRFPYGIIYRATDDAVFVIAVMHLRRRPAYWMGRL